MKTLKTILLSAIIIGAFFSCKTDKKEKENEEVNIEETIKPEGERTVLFENQYAKVEKVTLLPNQEQELHTGNDRIVYSLGDYSIEWTENGKNLGEKNWTEGAVHSHKSGSHKAKNIGKNAAEWLIFSKTDAVLPPCDEDDISKDVSSVKPEYATKLFENDEFKVTKVTLNANDSIPEHNGINRIVYSLSDFSLDFVSDKDGKVKKDFHKGHVHWHNACKHALKNTGNTTAEFLVIAYKK